MNSIIVNLLRDTQALDDLRAGLPYAFEVAKMEAERQEVGIFRERVIVGFLLSKLGFDAVEFPEPSNTVADVLIGGAPLQIKTVTRNGEITLKWTADTASVQEVIKNFSFESDLWLVRIWEPKIKESLLWESENKESLLHVFYVPCEVLQETARKTPNFLRSDTGNNNRGIKLKRSFMELIERDRRTTSVEIRWRWNDDHIWHPSPSIQHPLYRYMRYWDSRGVTPLQ